jgi:hypothetical protein
LIVAEELPKSVDAFFEVVVLDYRVRPYEADQLVFGDEMPVPANEQNEHLKGFLRQSAVFGPVKPYDRVVVHVQAEFPESEYLLHFLQLRHSSNRWKKNGRKNSEFPKYNHRASRYDCLL